MTQASTRTVELGPLLAALDDARVLGEPELSVGSLVHDSRAVRPGSLFVALRGERHDGHAFVERAIAAGARVVVVDSAFAAAHGSPGAVTTVVVGDTRRALSQLAAAYYGNPSKSLQIAGVTGTNGKTTTTHLIQRILETAGVRCGRIGTLGAQFGGAMWSLDNTTPLALELQMLLAEMRDRGAAAVALEMSFDALALDRARDVDVDVAVLTNVTRDHLDFHKTFEAYAAAKRTLFESAAFSVFNADDPLGRQWAAEFPAAQVQTYGLGVRAGAQADDVALGPNGSTFTLDGLRFRYRFPGASTSRTRSRRSASRGARESRTASAPARSPKRNRFRAGWRASRRPASRSSSTTRTRPTHSLRS